MYILYIYIYRDIKYLAASPDPQITMAEAAIPEARRHRVISPIAE